MQLQEVGDEVTVTLQTAGNGSESDQTDLLEQVRDSFSGSSVDSAYSRKALQE